MTRWLRAFGAFCYELVIGDDWVLTAAAVAGLGLTIGLAHAGLPAWWVLPVTIALALPARVWRARRR